MPGPIRRLAHVLASVAVLSLALMFVEATAAGAGGTWSSPSDIDGDTYITSVSCPSATFCVAVDEDGNALTYNGSSWSSPSDIDGSNSLISVSCPSARFCAAVDEDGNALTYNGSSWSSPSDINGSEILTSVSCASADFCVAVGINALTYNGSSWSSPSDVDSSGHGFWSVSCPSTTFCVAVDDAGNALTYNGSSWSSPSAINDSSSLLSVSCPSATFCVAVGEDGNALTYNGSSWSSPSDIDGSESLWSVSCPTTSFCAAVDGHGNALTYNGSSWSSPSDIDVAMSTLRSVSCPSATFCVAVDPVGNVFTYNGSPTTSVLVPSNGATLSGSSYLDASASNATSVEFLLFGGSYGYSAPTVCTATPTYYGWLCDWNTSPFPNGSYVLVSEASNSAGSTFSAGVSITVENPPTTSVLVPSNGATLSGSSYLDASASNATSVEFLLFGGSYGYSAPTVCTATPTYYGWLCDWNTSPFPNGSYVLVSEASNSAGSTFSAGVSITVDN